MSARPGRFLALLTGAAFVPIVCSAATTGPDGRPPQPHDRREFRDALALAVGTYSARPETPATARSAESNRRAPRAIASALRAVAGGMVRPEEGWTDTHRAFRLAEAFSAKTEPLLPDVVERLRELGRASASVTTLRAHFEQEKHVTIVRDVLRSSGTFWLDKRGRIAWQVAEPDPVRVVIRTDGVFVAGKRVWTQSPGRGEERVPGATLSPLPMLEGLNGIFAGVSEQTVRDFEVTFRDRERLRLVPRARSLSGWLSAIEITLGGQAQTPQLVRLEEPDGDVTEITFSDVTVNPPLDDAAFAP